MFKIGGNMQFALNIEKHKTLFNTFYRQSTATSGSMAKFGMTTLNGKT